MKSFVHCHRLPGVGTTLLILLTFLLSACNFIGGSPPTNSIHEQLAPTSLPGIQLGEQPCPAAVQAPTYWNAIIGLAADQTVERVACGSLVGLPTLQAVVAVRHASSDHML